ncbi:uncharacterized protein ASCRUDRAFT_15506 [Ascoidea rubescens DSM 1968]|uniref:Uncharacterized protein n=1 Tax=Ascoidea rubescens DSM 1968 TaxID=1344418 RepID=A0A1D2VA67_9ASCO|nr:hypothetical protein ASCRUDRAFT_15506 [Ascoidea rubescens DSM 1968]ODV58576.1 hypothetical protein ASCRUDRAFT_15506 [Ascoidea rubescens DSM 1968]
MNHQEIQNLLYQQFQFSESRIKSLYSNFDDLIVDNIDGYQANLQIWKDLLSKIISNLNILIFDFSNILDDLAYHHKSKSEDHLIPLSLDTVINDLINDDSMENRFFLPLTLFNNSKTSIYYKKNLVSNLVYWVLNKLTVGFINSGINYNINKNSSKSSSSSLLLSKKGNYLKSDQFINIFFLNKLRLLILEQINEVNLITNKIFLKDDLILILKNIFLTKLESFNPTLNYQNNEETYFDSIFTYLSRDKNDIIISTDSATKNQFIKFKSSNNELTITEEEKSIAQIKYSISLLNLQITKTDSKISDVESKIKNLLPITISNKPIIKIYLKSKKVLQSNLIKFITNLDQLDSILSSINQAKTNIIMADTLQKSNLILKDLNNKISLDELENLIDEIDDQKSQIDQVNQELSRLSDTNDDIIINEEIDKEFEQMLKEEKLREEKLKEEKLKEEKLKAELKAELKEESKEKQNKILAETNQNTPTPLESQPKEDLLKISKEKTEETPSVKNNETAESLEVSTNHSSLVERLNNLKIAHKNSVEQNLSKADQEKEKEKLQVAN